MNQAGLYIGNGHLGQIGESKIKQLCSVTGIALLKMFCDSNNCIVSIHNTFV